MADDSGTEKLQELVNRLDSATRRGLIDWEPTDREFAYLYSTKNSSVIVASADNDGAIPIELQILNEKGHVIDSMRSHLISEGFGDEATFTAARGGKGLAAMYERVKRTVLGVDKAIDELLSELPPEEDP